MLANVLKKEECAACRFCCSFRRKSLWELPRLPLRFLDDYKNNPRGESVDYKIMEENGEKFAITNLENNYRTDDSEEEVPCPFLDARQGCMLPPEDKPFECKAWPLRYMKTADGTLHVCLTPTCPRMNKVDLGLLREQTRQTWAEQFRQYAENHPYIVKDYKEGFVILG